MALDAILQHITGEAGNERRGILDAAQRDRETVLAEARREAERRSRAIVEREAAAAAARAEKVLVDARLEAKKRLLAAKQEALDAVFKAVRDTMKKAAFKKERVYMDKVQEAPEDVGSYLEDIRHDHEHEIAQILFR